MRVSFLKNLWGDFNPSCNYFTELLKMKYDVQVVDYNQSPDLLFFTGRGFGNIHRDQYLPGTRKISVNGEHTALQQIAQQSAHLHLSHDPTGGDNVYYPHWLMYLDWWENTPADFLSCSTSFDPLASLMTKTPQEKSRFCSYIAKHGGLNPMNHRADFVTQLMKYKQVDCPGQSLNNINWGDIPTRAQSPRPGDKMEFLKPYKFNVSFENRSDYGYITEKVIHPYIAGCVPVYWGGTRVYDDFNMNSMVYVNDFSEAIKKITEIDNNDQMYADIINEPIFKDNKVPEIYTPEYILAQIEKIL